MLKILETPRDAMQGLNNYIPTSKKVELINSLLKVGFDIIDVGSIVSADAIPQLRDTNEVIRQIESFDTKSKLFVLVANMNGAKKAVEFDNINYLGFPFSTSETFLKKNINSTIEKTYQTIEGIQNLCNKSNKSLWVYLTMAFGNPYGDPSNIDIVLESLNRLHQSGINIVSLSDITGISTPEIITEYYKAINAEFPEIISGIHLHIKNDDWYDKIDAAYKNGCKIIDGVINGLGGCPMTGYELLGNLPTGNIIDYAKKNNIPLNIDEKNFSNARKVAMDILV